MLAPQAAGVIHTDFEEFIKAEVVSYEDYLAWERLSCPRSRQIPLGRKEYPFQDGDVALFGQLEESILGSTFALFIQSPRKKVGSCPD